MLSNCPVLGKFFFSVLAVGWLLWCRVCLQGRKKHCEHAQPVRRIEANLGRYRGSALMLYCEQLCFRCLEWMCILRTQENGRMGMDIARVSVTSASYFKKEGFLVTRGAPPTQSSLRFSGLTTFDEISSLIAC